MSDVAAQLARALQFADAVKEALPVDEDAERLVARLLNERSRGFVPRKLSR